MNNEKARIINVYTFSKKDTGDVYARMTYSIKMQRTNNFCGSSVESVGNISAYIDKEVDIKIENVPGSNRQMVARLVQVGNEKLIK